MAGVSHGGTDAVQRETEQNHLLAQARPIFLDQLDSDPQAAFEAFYRFAVQLLTVSPPGPLRPVHPEDRLDLIHEVIVHCCDRDFRVLRRYVDQGKPFAAWLAFVARNRIIDILRARGRISTIPADDPAEGRPGETLVDPEPLADRAVYASDLLAAVTRSLAKLSETCRLLVEAAADGSKPQELTRLLRWPDDWNKKVSDDLRACRKRLAQFVLEEGFDLADVTGVAPSRRQERGSS